MTRPRLPGRSRLASLFDAADRSARSLHLGRMLWSADALVLRVVGPGHRRFRLIPRYSSAVRESWTSIDLLSVNCGIATVLARATRYVTSPSAGSRLFLISSIRHAGMITGALRAMSSFPAEEGQDGCSDTRAISSSWLEPPARDLTPSWRDDYTVQVVAPRDVDKNPAATACTSSGRVDQRGGPQTSRHRGGVRGAHFPRDASTKGHSFVLTILAIDTRTWRPTVPGQQPQARGALPPRRRRRIAGPSKIASHLLALSSAVSGAHGIVTTRVGAGLGLYRIGLPTTHRLSSTRSRAPPDRLVPLCCPSIAGARFVNPARLPAGTVRRSVSSPNHTRSRAL